MSSGMEEKDRQIGIAVVAAAWKHLLIQVVARDHSSETSVGSFLLDLTNLDLILTADERMIHRSLPRARRATESPIFQGTLIHLP